MNGESFRLNHKPVESRAFASRPEIRYQNVIAWRREVPLRDAAAAIGEVGDVAVLAYRHDGEGVAPHLLEVHGQAGRDSGRGRVDLAVHAPGLILDALRAVRVARGPDEDGLVVGGRLRQHADRLAVVGALLLSGVGVNQPRIPEAQIQKVEPSVVVLPRENLLVLGGVRSVIPRQTLKRYGVVDWRCRSERYGEDRKIGSPGDAVRVVVNRRNSDPGDDARHRRAVRELVADLVGRTFQELLGHRLSIEQRVRLVDAGVDYPNGLAGAGLNVFALGEGEARVRLVGVDFCRSFFPWYNTEHRHGGVAMLTPHSVAAHREKTEPGSVFPHPCCAAETTVQHASRRAPARAPA